MTASDIETLRYGFGECALGIFLVALSDSGIAALHLGERSRRVAGRARGRISRRHGSKMPRRRSATRREGSRFSRCAGKQARSAARHSRLRPGTRGLGLGWPPFPPAKPSPTARLRRRCRCRRRRRRSAPPARPIGWRWRSRAIASSRPTARSPAIAGACAASGGCWRWKRRHEYRLPRGADRLGRRSPRAWTKTAGRSRLP